MKLVQVLVNDLTIWINPDQITFVESVGNEQYRIHFASDKQLTIHSKHGNPIDELLDKISGD